MYTVFTNIIEYNLELQKKQDLFTEKMTELKGLFGKLSYDELKQLSFDTPLSIMGGGKKKNKKTEEPVVTDTTEEHNNEVETDTAKTES